jgi:hypothetical protein
MIKLLRRKVNYLNNLKTTSECLVKLISLRYGLVVFIIHLRYRNRIFNPVVNDELIYISMG